MSETINIPRDTTMQLLVKVHRDQIAGEMDLKYKEKVAAATSKAEVDALFAEWWKIQYNPDLYTKSEMLERWFGNVLVDTRVHGTTTPRYSKSTSMIGELTDDSAGLTCTPSTESAAGSDPFAHLPQFWCLEVAAEKKQMVPMRFFMWSILTILQRSEAENTCAGFSRRIPTRESGRIKIINI